MRPRTLKAVSTLLCQTRRSTLITCPMVAADTSRAQRADWRRVRASLPTAPRAWCSSSRSPLRRRNSRVMARKMRPPDSGAGFDRRDAARLAPFHTCLRNAAALSRATASDEASSSLPAGPRPRSCCLHPIMYRNTRDRVQNGSTMREKVRPSENRHAGRVKELFRRGWQFGKPYLAATVAPPA